MSPRRAVVAALAVGVTVATAAVAVAASVGVSSQHLGTATLAAPVFYPASLVTAGPKNKTGTLANGDSYTLTFNRQANQPSVCSGWSNSSAGSTVSVVVTVNDNAAANGDDTVTVGGAPAAKCASGIHLGVLDLGSPNYVTGGPLRFTTSTAALSQGGKPMTTKIKVTLNGQQAPGAGVGTVGSGVSGSPAVWSAGGDATVITDTATPAADAIGLNSATAQVGGSYSCF